MKFLLVLVILGAVGWHFYKPPPPGVGPKAEAGKRVSNGMIQAIESFRSERGVYPEDLEDLVPDFVTKVPTFSNGSQLDYQRSGATYQLSFNYSDPVPVHCSYQPGAKWACEWF
jgi:hypothetical protein